jgi:hypothetical protein
MQSKLVVTTYFNIYKTIIETVLNVIKTRGYYGLERYKNRVVTTVVTASRPSSPRHGMP